MTPLHAWDHPSFREAGITVFIKRDDLAGDEIGGNKFRKLRDILTAERLAGRKGVLSFGGPFSNHLLALAAASAALGVPSRGLIRGEEVSNVVTRRLRALGMALEFVGRTGFQDAQLMDHDGWLVIPMGGASPLALGGVAESVREVQSQCTVRPDFHAIPAGTGSTAAGMVTALDGDDTLLVFPAIRGDNPGTWFDGVLHSYGVQARCTVQVDERSPGKGFARRDADLWAFIREEYRNSGFLFDPVYNGKMARRLTEMAREGSFPRGTVVVAYHTGGWAGREGYRERYGFSLP